MKSLDLSFYRQNLKLTVAVVDVVTVVADELVVSVPLHSGAGIHQPCT